MSKRSRESFYDPLRPQVDPATVRPYHEDRVLIRWTPAPEQPGLIKQLQLGPRDRGPHYGVVVAVGPGNSGLHKKPTGEQVRTSGTPRTVFKLFKCESTQFNVKFRLNAKLRPQRTTKITFPLNPDLVDAGYRGWTKPVAPPTVKPGDRVYYHRTPENEFVSDGETYSLVFEEQAILAVIE